MFHKIGLITLIRQSVIGCAVLVIVIAVPSLTYLGADRAGYVPHTSIRQVYGTGWDKGEIKACLTYSTNAAWMGCQQENDDSSTFTAYRYYRVRFWGKPSMEMGRWFCTQDDAEIVCKASGEGL
jgi:hypothetical protein